MEICVTVTRRNGMAMELKSHIDRANLSSRKHNYLLNEFYSNPSMTEDRQDEERKVQRKVPFSVEWQMYNV